MPRRKTIIVPNHPINLSSITNSYSSQFLNDETNDKYLLDVKSRENDDLIKNFRWGHANSFVRLLAGSLIKNN